MFIIQDFLHGHKPLLHAVKQKALDKTYITIGDFRTNAESQILTCLAIFCAYVLPWKNKNWNFAHRNIFTLKNLYWLLWRHRWWTCHKVIKDRSSKGMLIPKLNCSLGKYRSHGPPYLIGCTNTSCYTFSTRIPDLFPVQQLGALNFIISWMRLSQIQSIRSSFPSPPRCICNTRRTGWTCSIKLMEVSWTVLYAKGKTVPIKLD